MMTARGLAYAFAMSGQEEMCLRAIEKLLQDRERETWDRAADRVRGWSFREAKLGTDVMALIADLEARADSTIQVVSAKADESGSPGVPSGVGEPGSGVAASALPPAQTPSKEVSPGNFAHDCPRVPQGFAGLLGREESCRLCGWKAGSLAGRSETSLGVVEGHELSKPSGTTIRSPSEQQVSSPAPGSPTQTAEQGGWVSGEWEHLERERARMLAAQAPTAEQVCDACREAWAKHHITAAKCPHVSPAGVEAMGLRIAIQQALDEMTAELYPDAADTLWRALNPGKSPMDVTRPGDSKDG